MKNKAFSRFLAALLCVMMAAGCAAFADPEEPEAEAPACQHGSTETREETVEEPGCTKDGSHYVITLCADCGEELSRKTVTDAAKGHDYKQTGRTEPTYDADGSVTYTCSRCGDSYSDVLPKLEKPAEKEPEEEKKEEPEVEEPEEEPGDAQSGDEKPGDGESGDEKPGDSESGDEKPGDDESGDEKPGDDESGDEKPGDDESGNEKPGDDESGDEKPGDDESGDEKPGDAQSGDEKPGEGESGDEKPGDDESGDDESGDEKPGDDESGDEKPENDESEDEKPGDEEPGEEEQNDEDGEILEPVSWTREPVEWTPKNSGPDNDELLDAYLNQIMNAPLRTRKGTRGSDAGSRLSGRDRAAYDVLKSRIMDIAAGRETSTVITISAADDLGVEYYGPWTAEDLGEPAVFGTDGKLLESTKKAAYAKIDFNLSAVLDALLADCPYELYWYDKTVQSQSSYSQIWSYSYGAGNDYVTLQSYDEETHLFVNISPVITVYLPVSQNYADGDAYTVDADKARAANAAVSNALAIVNEAAGMSIENKLAHYRDEICRLVSYNKAAAADDSTPYGDPWQLISVFDGDSRTNVVCEGYSKAFKYLCDLDGSISCLTVSGTMEASGSATGEGPHMWNVVKMSDGNYLVDVTNCDEGSTGSDDLFMVCDPIGRWDDYKFTVGEGAASYAISYEYDNDTKTTYGSARITIKGTTEPVTVMSASLTLKGEIGVNFSIGIPESISQLSGAKAVFVYKGNETEILLSEVTPVSGEEYVFTYRMPVKEIANPVSLRIMDGDRILPMTNGYDGSSMPEDTLTYSVTKYCNTVQEMGGTKLKNLCRALTNYGYYANKYFRTNETVPATLDPIGLDTVTADVLAQYAASKDGEITGLTLGTFDLVLKSETSLRIHFSVNDFSGNESSIVKNLTVRCGGKTLPTVSEGNGTYRVVLENLPAKDLDTTYHFVFTCGEQTMTLSCSALSYAYNALSSGEQDLVNTVKAMYLYNQAANAFFGK